MEASRRFRPRRPEHTVLFRLVRAPVRGLLRLLFRLRLEGRERYPAGAAVLVANHPSALDPLFLAAALPERVLMLAAEEFLAMPGVGWAMRAYGCIPVRRGEVDAAAVRAALTFLAQGAKVVVFAEGAVSPQARPVQRGAGLLAAQAGVPLVPVALRGSGRVFPLGARVPRLGRVTVAVGPPQPPPWGGRDAQQAAVDRAMAWVRAAAASG